MNSVLLHIDGVHFYRGFIPSFAAVLNKNLDFFLLSLISVERYTDLTALRFSVAQEAFLPHYFKYI